MSCSRLPPSEPSAATIPTPASLTSSKKKPRPSCVTIRISTTVIVARSPHAPGRLRADLALDQTAAARAIRSRDRLSRRSAQLAADVAQRRARRESATKWPGEAGCTRRACRAPARCGRVIRSSANGMCCCRSASRHPIRRSTRRRCRRIRRAAVGRRAPACRRRHRGRQSHHRRARQRRQSVSPLAVGVLRRAGLPARVKGSEAPYHPHVGSVRCRQRRRPSPRDARARLAPPTSDRRSSNAASSISQSCARSIGRAALYIGGDSGPLHIAGTTGVPVVGLYGPTLPVRSQPYRSARFISAAAEVHGSAVPPVRSAALRARRFSLSDRNLGRTWRLAERARTNAALGQADWPYENRSAELQVGQRMYMKS